MPTIRIDDDVFAALQKKAEPFTDTPNSVIKRLLEEAGALPKRSAIPVTATAMVTKPLAKGGQS